MKEKSELYRSLTDLGNFYGTNFLINLNQFYSELQALEKERDPWVYYNPRKPGYNRWGLSLTSLDGDTSGYPDLDSIREYNLEQGTDLDEMSFQTSTEYWNLFKSISNNLQIFEPFLGRSHILRLDECGAFPPHRDFGQSFRLISLLRGDPSNLYLMLDGQKVFYTPGKVYFLDARKEHCLFSFTQKAMVLVLNVEINLESIRAVRRNLDAT